MFNRTQDNPRTVKLQQRTIGGGADEEDQCEREEQSRATNAEGGWRRRIYSEFCGFLASANQEQQGPTLLAAWERTNASIRMVVRGVAMAGAIRARRTQRALATELTPREREVLELVLCGYKAPTIAECLCISLHTVHMHTRNASGKLCVSGAWAAAIEARRLRLIQDDGENTQM
jgi:ATP/maltotriose-dependent transcriptional regulator MalT